VTVSRLRSLNKQKSCQCHSRGLNVSFVLLREWEIESAVSKEKSGVSAAEKFEGLISLTEMCTLNTERTLLGYRVFDLAYIASGESTHCCSCFISNKRWLRILSLSFNNRDKIIPAYPFLSLFLSSLWRWLPRVFKTRTKFIDCVVPLADVPVSLYLSKSWNYRHRSSIKVISLIFYFG